MKTVTLREPGTERVFDHDANRTAMEVPPDWPDDAVVVVSGDDLEWIRPGSEPVVWRSRTRRLEQFFAGDRCVIPSDRVSTSGRTVWRVVEVVTAVRIGGFPG
jgi:hypothetical protein